MGYVWTVKSNGDPLCFIAIIIELVLTIVTMLHYCGTQSLWYYVGTLSTIQMLS